MKPPNSQTHGPANHQERSEGSGVPEDGVFRRLVSDSDAVACGLVV